MKMKTNNKKLIICLVFADAFVIAAGGHNGCKFLTAAESTGKLVIMSENVLDAYSLLPNL